ncbi:type I-E CRISPR-associated protein Cas6/Cse3/CasE [Kutzneria sp. NPDC052558]|uniref:type I-E CRISPR-associated protein Cas6/Cse3/CasE n=1 Tax=Kutzneria sp. NPDC052558 TaxID=3364121 RepID=UPI0037C67F26
MFLTKLSLNPRSSAVRRDLDDINDMHRTLMSAYPELASRDNFRQTHGVLWRIDTLCGGLIQYIQSHTEPAWSRLAADYLTRPAEVRTLAPVLDSVRPGRKYAFRLVGNPTRCIHNDANLAIRRHVPLGSEHHLDWLVNKGSQHGFIIPAAHGGHPDVACTGLPRLTGKRGKPARVTITPVRFDGHLVVTDPDAFKAALVTGIGRAKPYGCGLLTLARTQN